MDQKFGISVHFNPVKIRVPSLEFQKKIKQVGKGIFWKKSKKCYFGQKWTKKPFFFQNSSRVPVFWQYLFKLSNFKLKKIILEYLGFFFKAWEDFRVASNRILKMSNFNKRPFQALKPMFFIFFLSKFGFLIVFY